uniref:Uncharacterized protein n=1 Tax=Chromera velia CCMP2878 TaxID=1169474 RepID=A0A0G4FQV5_9ALVE|eukprot:Cvel_18284.t1-p1 / transcript=Cvel_18284.t1 / gene=Cvel_18284 / organism=Chromera_velia_CCMP2878 / gene_product=Protein IWS1 homolog, putative / transcript_product=Protein IWS1 homolog, putative / location=Cvel_scaffold1506:41036-43873(-) / protein_length=570 / sequence_SO=supercontig / SO=protein_coding / is_pseudo=false
MASRRCAAVLKSGERCKSTARGNGFCGHRAHQALADASTAASSKAHSPPLPTSIPKRSDPEILARFHVRVAVALGVLLLSSASMVFWQSWSVSSLAPKPNCLQYAGNATIVMHSAEPLQQTLPSPKFSLIAQNLYRMSSLNFVTEIFSHPTSRARAGELVTAINLSSKSHPGSRYVLLTSDTDWGALGRNILAGLEEVSYDLYYVGEVVWGTLLEAGNYYPGIKIATNADIAFPPINFECNWNSNPPPIFGFSRADTHEYSGNLRSCKSFMGGGSYDAIAFKSVKKDALRMLHFSKSYWGTENVAAWVLDKVGQPVQNMCPWYFPIHVHNDKKVGDTRQHRIRINGGNSKQPNNRKTQDFCTFTNPMMPEEAPRERSSLSRRSRRESQEQPDPPRQKGTSKKKKKHTAEVLPDAWANPNPKARDIPQPNTLNENRREKTTLDSEQVAPYQSEQKKKQTVAEPVSQPKKKQRVAEPVSQPKKKQRVAEPVSQPKKKQTVAEPVSQPKKKQSVAEPVSQPKKKQAAAETASQPKKKQTVAEPVSHPKKKQTVIDTARQLNKKVEIKKPRKSG